MQTLMRRSSPTAVAGFPVCSLPPFSLATLRTQPLLTERMPAETGRDTCQSLDSVFWVLHTIYQRDRGVKEKAGGFYE